MKYGSYTGSGCQSQLIVGTLSKACGRTTNISLRTYSERFTNNEGKADSEKWGGPAPPQVVESIGSAGKTRTYNPPVNSRMLCH